MDARFEKAIRMATEYTENLDKLDLPLIKIVDQFAIALATIHELHIQGIGIQAEAKKMESEVKQHPNDLQYVRERARKLRALNAAHNKNVMAANAAGKLTLPKIPKFEEIYSEDKTRAEFYKSELKRIAGSQQGDHLGKALAKTLTERKDSYGSIVSRRSGLVKRKNAMLDVADENSNIAIRLGEAAVKLGEAEAQKLRAQPVKVEVTDAEAQKEFAVIATKIAQGQVKLGEAEQREFNLPTIAMPTLDLRTMALPTTAPLSDLQINAGLSNQPGAVSLTHKNTPPSPTGSGSDSEGENKDSPKAHPATVKTQPSTPDTTPPGTPQLQGVPDLKFPGQPASASEPTMAAAHTRLNGADIAKQRLAEAAKQKEMEAQKQQQAARSGFPATA